MTRITLREARAHIAARKPFTSSAALTGDVVAPGQHFYPTLGRLREGVDQATFAGYVVQLHGADYVVSSYQTPIAWHVPGTGWVRPQVRYSVTTSRHQGLCPTTTQQEVGA